MAPTNRSLANEIDAVPPSARESMRRGFAVAANLSDDERKNVVAALITAIGKGGGTIDLEPIAKRADLSERQVASLATAILGAIGLLSKNKASTVEFVVAAADKLFEQKHSVVASFIAEQVGVHSNQLEELIERETLAAQTLPAVTGFNVSVDLRFKFEDEEIRGAVPVAIIHIDTDGEPELSAQISRGDLERILETLHRTARRMEAAENLFKKFKAGS